MLVRDALDVSLYLGGWRRTAATLFMDTHSAFPPLSPSPRHKGKGKAWIEA
ncbi:hypothetical protein J2129_001974 [Methanofollis sp. W23]|nr:hypothetical protein [Methanofollis sp. W23]